MSVQNWLTTLREAKKTAFIQDGVKKIHFHLNDGKELVEEYSLENNVLVRRAWRVKKAIGGLGDWEVEVGEPITKVHNLDAVGIKENSNEPFIVRKITKTHLEWRIRNLNYPVDVYSVTADGRCIVVRTSNKKYFKKLTVPDLDRIGAPVEQNLIEYNHKYNTLIITYKKPVQLLNLEKQVIEEVKNVKVVKDVNECNPS